MPTNTITFDTNAAQTAKVREAMAWRLDREDPAGAPHDPTNAEVMFEVREIALQFIKSEVRSELRDKRRALAVSDDNVDGIT